VALGVLGNCVGFGFLIVSFGGCDKFFWRGNEGCSSYWPSCVCVMRDLAWVFLSVLGGAAHEASREFSVLVAFGACFTFFVRAGSSCGVLLSLTWRSKGRAAS
jgi:hypothetical protein